MTFVYNEITISGGNRDVHGITGVLNALTDHLVTCGFVLVDDRRSQPGSATLSLTHKVVLSSDGGESGLDPNFYITLTSGLAAATTATQIGMQVSTAYDVGAHAVPASGIKSPDTFTLSQLRSFTMDVDGYNRLWMSADQDAISFVQNYIGDTYWTVDIGKADTFLDGDLEPYGVYLSSIGAIQSTPTSVFGLMGNNPVNPVLATNDSGFVSYIFAAANQPTQGMGNEEPRWAAMPITWIAFNSVPLTKGWIGFVKHKFSAASKAEGIPTVGEAVDILTGQEFKVFSSTTSFFLRKT